MAPRAETMTTAVRDLLAALPAGIVSEDAADRRSHATDSWPLVLKWDDDAVAEATPLAVVRPRDAQEVGAVLRACSEGGIPVVPYGAGSGVVGGAVPEQPAISLDTSALVGIVALHPHDAMVTVRAGTIAADLEAELQAAGFTLGHYPQSLALATVGGLVATRSSGTFSSKYGNVEDRLVGLEVVLADGTVVTTKLTPRAATGPSLAQLFVGSEGTLGVITEVTLKVLPEREVCRFRGVAFDDLLGDGLGAVHDLLGRGITPAVIRLYDAAEAEHLYGRAGVEPGGRALLVLGFDGPARLAALEEELALECCAARGGTDLGSGIGELWERTRYRAEWLEEGNAGGLAMADAIEVSAPWSRLPEVYERIAKALDGTVDRLVCHFSHFYGQGGSLYAIVSLSADSTAEVVARYRRAWELTMQEVLAAGGSISHHHGIGRMRVPWLAEELGSTAGLLETIKDALDPAGVLNPGKLGLGQEDT